MKSFSKWTIEDVEDTFQLELQKKYPLLDDWVSGEYPISNDEMETLSRHQTRLLDSVWDWNEDELKAYFIVPLLDLVGFDNNKYKSFMSREIETSYNNEKLSGVVDFVVASGRRSPKSPFFFIQEYKKEHGSSDDPLGQVMIAMVAAQLLNKDEYPIYGAYIIGRYWHFAVLSGKEYAVHTGFNATDDELLQIFHTLKETKQIIEQRVQLL